LATAAKYRDIFIDGWHLRVLQEKWTDELWNRVLPAVRNQVSQKHPQTLSLRYNETADDQLFLKIYHGGRALVLLKDRFRMSKAFRFLKQGAALSEAGFLAPLTIAAGEERRFGFLRKAFVLTVAVEAKPLPVFLKKQYCASSGIRLADKRNGIKSLGSLVRNFHDLGFVHGDLVASNILVSPEATGALRFYFMDNDRTRRYPRWLPHTLWKRNLVQLNRLPLPGISLQDRMRFFRAYAGDRIASKKQELYWLEAETRRRRIECEGIQTASFRKLMSWS
jgi:Lipopolysaccharide kinase (Kdo/WaaP) family